MGTWSQPNTTAKATQLKQLMASPIIKTEAADLLYHLCGDDDLFDSFEELRPNEDVRLYVQFHIKEILENLHLSLLSWDKEAINICRKLFNEKSK
jgi:hypothetical protein